MVVIMETASISTDVQTGSSTEKTTGVDGIIHSIDTTKIKRLKGGILTLLAVSLTIFIVTAAFVSMDWWGAAATCKDTSACGAIAMFLPFTWIPLFFGVVLAFVARTLKKRNEELIGTDVAIKNMFVITIVFAIVSAIVCSPIAMVTAFSI